MTNISFRERKKLLNDHLVYLTNGNSGVRLLSPVYAGDYNRILLSNEHKLFEFRVNDKNHQHVDIQEIVHGLDPGTIGYGKTVTMSDMSSIKTTNDILKLFVNFEFEGKLYNHSDIDRLLTNLNMIKQYIKDKAMKPNIVDYVVVCETEDSEPSYLHRDEFHYYFSNGFHSAEHFKTVEDAKLILNTSEFTRESKMSDGTVYPPSAIHRALQLNNAKMSGKGKLKILPVLIGEPVETIEISGSIKEPKGYTY